jgi:hypothetical protein
MSIYNIFILEREEIRFGVKCENDRWFWFVIFQAVII